MAFGIRSRRTVLITGATGKQGGAVLRHLLGNKNFKLRAMTRKPSSDAARLISRLGADLVQADLDDENSLRAALNGAWGVFAVQTRESGVEREEEQGKRIARLARELDVQHFVYSSVASAPLNTGIPHFDNKWRIEQTVRALNFPTWAIMRPVFFMENLTSSWFLRSDKLVTALKPETVLQMVAVDDIGRFGALLIDRAGQMSGSEIEIAGDTATMPQVAELLGRALHRKVDYLRIPIEEVRKSSPEYALMLEYFDRVGYGVDIAGLEKKLGFRMTKLPEWVRLHVIGSVTAKAS